MNHSFDVITLLIINIILYSKINSHDVILSMNDR